ncbi:MAG: DUF3341 domain-containing protein [Deltaproteobacteria bacterium]|nr:DUF3341 domain-containing protein [Deltaproteobacteria bacterium]
MTERVAAESYDLMAEFDTGEAVVAAARGVRERGYVALDAYSPLHVEGLAEALGFRSRIPVVTFLGGLFGGLGILTFQIWAQAIDWTLNVGGRHASAIPAFLVPTFELTILGAALGTFFAVLWRSHLPEPWHPVFEVPAFARASQDRFFLVVRADDPGFHPAETRALLVTLGALEVHDVPR